jgi:hypothetical protein
MSDITKTIHLRYFGFQFDDEFIQGDFSVRMKVNEAGSVSHVQEIFLIKGGLEYTSPDLAFGERTPEFMKKLQSIFNVELR